MKPQNLANLQYNTKVQTYTKAVIALIAGSSAGYLGLQGLNGLYYWCVWSLFGTLLEFAKSKGKPQNYFFESASGISYLASAYVSQTMSLGLTFVLFWTFFFNIIHVYQ